MTRLTGPAAQAALDLAVSGSRPDVLAAMARSGGWAPGDLDPLVMAGLVEVDDARALRFTSEEARDLVLQAVPLATACESHHRAAVACSDLHLPVRLVVDHLVRSTLLANDEVAAELEQAAVRAEAEDDLRAASDAWGTAALLSQTAPDRVARAVRSLRLVVVNGLDYTGVESLLDLLAGEQLSGECASWVEWIRALQRSDLDPESAVTAQWSTIRRARTAAPETLRALLWDAAFNAWTLGDPEGGLRAAREYADLEAAFPEEGVEPPWTGAALLAAGLFETGAVEEAARLRILAINAAASVDPLSIPVDRLLSIVFLDDLLLDMTPQASNRIHVALQRTPDGTAALACLYGIEAWRSRARCDWSTADQLLDRGRPLAAATGATGAQLGMGALVVELAAIRGAADTLEQESSWLRALATRKGDRRRLATLDRALGLCALGEGRLDEAIVRLTAPAEGPFLGRGLRDGVLTGRVDLIEALARMGDDDGARTRAREVRTVLESMESPLATALAHRVCALTSVGDTAIDAYRAALAAHDGTLEAFERARTLLLLGEAERRCRRRGDARLHLIEAVEVFDLLGAGRWAKRARNELRAVGGRVEPAAGVEGLTAQELSVARQAATGASTREVAEALFLSPRTVEFHLGNAYRKLGIRGRAALAARLGAHGAAPS